MEKYYQGELRGHQLNRPVLHNEQDDYDLWQRARIRMKEQSVCVHEGAAKACHHKDAASGKNCQCHHGMVFTFKCTGYRSQMFPNGR